MKRGGLVMNDEGVGMLVGGVGINNKKKKTAIKDLKGWAEKKSGCHEKG